MEGPRGGGLGELGAQGCWLGEALMATRLDRPDGPMALMLTAFSGLVLPAMLSCSVRAMCWGYIGVRV